MTRKMSNGMRKIIRTYKELIQLPTFEERFDYLAIGGMIGEDTFGFDRYLNQKFYRSKEWKRIRDHVIVRDMGCDLGVEGYELYGKIIIHHMNPIAARDIVEVTDILLNPDYLISTSPNTHNAIHFGSKDILPKAPTERRPNDTCPWKQ